MYADFLFIIIFCSPVLDPFIVKCIDAGEHSLY